MKFLPKIFFPLFLAGILAIGYIVPRYFHDEQGDGGKFGSESRVVVVDVRKKAKQDHRVAIRPFLTKLKMRDLDGAEVELKKLHGNIPADLKTGLMVSLISARESESDIESAVAREKILLTKSQIELQKVKIENLRIEKARQQAEAEVLELRETKNQGGTGDIRATLAALMKTTEESAAEVAKLRASIDSQEIKSRTPSDLLFAKQIYPPVEDNVVRAPLKIPAPLTVHFEKDSKEIPDGVSKYVDQMGDWLKSDDRLGIRLRSVAQPKTEKELTMVEARLQNIKRTLIRNGASFDQIKDSTMVPETNNRTDIAVFNGIDLIFFERF